MCLRRAASAVLLLALAAPAAVTAADAPVYDPALAQRAGADARGMRHYVLVILKTGPRRTPDGEARDRLFAGHFANIGRLADAGRLVLAGPFGENAAGWRGLFLLAVEDVAEAQRLTATDPVIQSGEMEAEYHPWYGSAAVVLLPELHRRLVPPKPAEADR